MEFVSNKYKEEIIKLGREIKIKVGLQENNQFVEYDYSNKISDFSYNYDGDILKSIMTKVEFNSIELFEKDQIFEIYLGVKVGDNYEYNKFGRFNVYSVEKQEDTNNYHVIAYDDMLKAMKDYEAISNVTYPILVSNYIKKICNFLGIALPLEVDIYINCPNYNEYIQSELYLDTQGNSLGYTFRDVLDDLAGATASTIYIDANNRLAIDGPRSINNYFNIDGVIANTNKIAISGGTYTINNDKSITLNADVTRGYQTMTLYENIQGLETFYGLCDLKVGHNYRIQAEVVGTGGRIMLENKAGERRQTNSNSPSGTEMGNFTATENDTGIWKIIIDVYKDNPVTFKNIAIVERPYTYKITNDYLLPYRPYNYDLIDERFFKDTNVNVGKKYGPINSIVLSRSAGSDNIYRRDDDSILQNGLCELKIEDNEILNSANREDFIQAIFNALNGLEYYINDFATKGITLFSPTHLYRAKINNQIYQCLMVNDEINIDQGLEENTYNNEPKASVTDYSKADKTDRGIQQATITANKAEGKVEAIVSSIGDSNGNVTGASLILAINGDTSQAELNADKISLAGKTIQMTTDNIAINSTNFQLDSSGNMTANSGTFGGTLNTNQDCTVGNDLYVGQNQTGTGFDRKRIYMSTNSYIERVRFETINIEFIYLKCTQNNTLGISSLNRLYCSAMERGTCSLTGSTSSITFTNSYDNPPFIILTCKNTSGTTAYVGNVTSVTNYGFEAYRSGGGSGSVDFEWMAINLN